MVYTQEFRSQIINEVRDVKGISPVAKKHGLPASTVHGWIKSSKLKVDYKADIKKQSLKHENKILKNKLADAELELMILKDLLKKTYQN